MSSDIITCGITCSVFCLKAWFLILCVFFSSSLLCFFLDYRQEGEIQRERAELDMAKQREADLEARIKQLEQAQMNQGALVAQ